MSYFFIDFNWSPIASSIGLRIWIRVSWFLPRSLLLITLSESMFSSWPLFVAEAAFRSLNSVVLDCFLCLIDVCNFYCYILCSCVVFNFLFSFSSFFCCCYLFLVVIIVSVAFLRKGLWEALPLFSVFVSWADYRSLPCMLGLILLSKLVVTFCLLEGFRLFLNISCVFSFFDSFSFYFRFWFIFQVDKIFEFSLMYDRLCL